MFLRVELKKLLKFKQELLTDMKNLFYRRSDEVEKLAKYLADADQPLVDCMQQIMAMTQDKEHRQKELEQLQAAAQEIVNMVDPPEDGVVLDRTMLKHLCEAPQKIAAYVSETTRSYVAHVLGLLKSFRPSVHVDVLADGMAMDCSEEKFKEYLQEVRPTTEKIVESLEQEQSVGICMKQ